MEALAPERRGSAQPFRDARAPKLLRIELLGHPRLIFDGKAAALAGRPKVLPLLAFLLLHPGLLGRERVASSLWPEESDADARGNLRRHVHYLRDLLPRPTGASWLECNVRSIGWNSASNYTLDVDEFVQCASDPKRYEEAARLYAGDLLEGFDEAWLEEPRRELAVQHASCLLGLVAFHRARRSFAPARRYANELLARDPWREDALRQLLIVHYDAGDRAAAVAEYRRFARALRDEIGVDPMPETIAVFRAIEAGIPPPGAAPTETRTPARGAVEPALVGRAAELERLDRAWHLSVEGSSTLVLLTGEAGIGKSRIAREFAVTAEAQGGIVAFGAASVRETIPYQPIATIIRSLAAIAPTLSIDPVWLAALLPLAPELRAFVGGLPEIPALDVARERTRLFEAVAIFIEALAVTRPLCAVVEDLHWSGAATLELVEYLVRRLRGSRVLWIATFREEGAAGGAALRGLRGLLDAESAPVHVALGPLAEDQSVALLRSLGSFGDDDGARTSKSLHRYAGGNPFYLLELARARASGLSEYPSTPDSLRETILTRVRALPEGARTLLEVAAVIGSEFDLNVARDAVGWAEADCLDALQALVDRQLVRERRAGSVFAFSHQLLASAIYEAIGEAARVRRHRRIAHVFETYHGVDPEFAAEIAEHYDKGDDARRACDAYVRAARFALSLYAAEEAAAHAARARVLASSGRERFDATLPALEAAAIRGQRELQGALADELLEIAGGLDGDALCVALRKRIDAANLVSDHDTERRCIQRLSDHAQRLGSSYWRASALEAQIKVLRSTGRFEEEQRCFEELASLAVAGNSFVEAFMSHADTLIYQGRLEEARAILTRVRDALDPKTNATTLIRALSAFSRAALAAQDYAAMSDFAEQAYVLSRATGDIEGQALAEHNIANGTLYLFRVAEARTAYENALQIYERLGHRIGLAGIHVDYGLFHTELGLLAQALPLYEKGLEIAHAIDMRLVACVGYIDASYCYRLGGRIEPAKRFAVTALEGARRLGSPHLEAAALGVLGVAESLAGEVDAAIAHLQRGVELRRTGEPSPRLGDNLRGLAEALLLAGRVDDAHRTIEELLTMYDANPWLAPQPSEWLATAAEVLAAAGDATGARHRQQRAIAEMRARAAAIPDAATRAAFLELPFNRALRTRC